jgi:hypothetical protein
VLRLLRLMGLYLVAVDYPAEFGLPALAKGPVIFTRKT